MIAAAATTVIGAREREGGKEKMLLFN